MHRTAETICRKHNFSSRNKICWSSNTLCPFLWLFTINEQPTYKLAIIIIITVGIAVCALKPPTHFHRTVRNAPKSYAPSPHSGRKSRAEGRCMVTSFPSQEHDSSRKKLLRAEEKPLFPGGGGGNLPGAPRKQPAVMSRRWKNAQQP